MLHIAQLTQKAHQENELLLFSYYKHMIFCCRHCIHHILTSRTPRNTMRWCFPILHGVHRKTTLKSIFPIYRQWLCQYDKLMERVRLANGTARNACLVSGSKPVGIKLFLCNYPVFMFGHSRTWRDNLCHFLFSANVIAKSRHVRGGIFVPSSLSYSLGPILHIFLLFYCILSTIKAELSLKIVFYLFGQWSSVWNRDPGIPGSRDF